MRFILTVALVAFLTPMASQAQPYHNELGLYTEMTGDENAVNISVQEFLAFTVYLVITNPYNDEFDNGDGNLVGRAVEHVGAFEGQLHWDRTFVLRLSMELPNNGINFAEYPDLLVGYSTPVAVTSGSAVLATFSFLVLDSEPYEFFLGIFSSPTFPNSMAYVDADDQYGSDIVPLNPVSGDFAMPVFGINNNVVAIENESWGGVKALFR